jgi:type VI secretion system protein ImpI
MALTLRVENQTSLPNGGPLSICIEGKRGIDIGRDQHLDWTLPDLNRVVSSKHCQIRWRDNAYWLHDISTNGTFLFGAETRLPVPYRIRNGDRFVIGDYIISATVDGEEADASPPARPDSKLSYDNVWDAVGEVAAPINPKQLKAARDLRPMKPDFLEWAVDVPSSHAPVTTPSPNSSNLPPKEPLDDMSWARGSKQVSVSAPQQAPRPQPRRPVWTTGESDHPWGPGQRVDAKPNNASDDALPRPGAASHTRADCEPQSASPRDPASLPSARASDPEMEFVRLFSRGAGLPDDALSGCHPARLAEEIGQLLRLLVENTKQLLEDRQQAKRRARSFDRTTIQAIDNNPLKFTPTIEEAMRLMFGPPTRSYLDARAAFAQGFDNLKSHQLQTYSAMQYAVRALLAEFDPAEIEKNTSADRSLVDVFGSRKARLWDAYLSRWKVLTQSKKDATLSAFMNYFAESYDVGESKRDR